MDATCCFTGHRTIGKTDFATLGPILVSAIKKLYADEGYRVFISGAARGFDTYAAAAVCALRDDLPGLEMRLAVPYRGHDATWTAKEREYFARVSSLADRVDVLSERYDSGVYMRRNRWMVDRSSLVIAYNEGKSGGTMQTVLYALEQKKRVINLFDFCAQITEW